jgi:hypothetical protein
MKVKRSYGAITASIIVISAILYKSLTPLNYIEPYYHENSWLSTCYELNIFEQFDSLRLWSVYMNCALAIVIGVLIGFDRLSTRKTILIIMMNIVLVKLLPTVFRHGIFNLKIVLLMLIACTASTVITRLFKNKISKYYIFEIRKVKNENKK